VHRDIQRCERYRAHLDSPLREVVGHWVRFQERLQLGASAKLMTDGRLPTVVHLGPNGGYPATRSPEPRSLMGRLPTYADDR